MNTYPTYYIPNRQPFKFPYMHSVSSFHKKCWELCTHLISKMFYVLFLTIFLFIGPEANLFNFYSFAFFNFTHFSILVLKSYNSNGSEKPFILNNSLLKILDLQLILRDKFLTVAKIYIWCFNNKK